jgi:hypothetical protein
MTQKEDMQAGTTQVAGYFVGIGFLICAVIFVITSKSVAIPFEEQPAITAEQIAPGAFRVAMTDPPMINIGTLNQRCNDCHSLFKNIRDESRELTQHTHIELSHGTNDGCLNCHDKENRETLTLRGESSVAFNQVEQLCAQCHGPIYRDWEKGSHGKTIGYWNAELGESIKLTCTQCHDPHSPAFKPMKPLRGPNTLRMGDQHSNHGELIDERNPLQRWRLLEQEESSHPDHDEHEGDN